MTSTGVTHMARHDVVWGGGRNIINQQDDPAWGTNDPSLCLQILTVGGMHSWASLEEDDPKEVPQVDWERLEVTRELGYGRNSVVFGAYLTMEDGSRVEVAVKEQEKCPWGSAILREAEVLQALAGVRGVPKLYGVTKTSPHSLVMSRCRGITIKELKKRGRTRVCLAAVLDLCRIVSEIHERGVWHRDLHGGNILVDVTEEDEAGDVWLVDFGQARKHATKLSIEVEEAHVKKLLRNILLKMLKDPDQDVVGRCNEALKFLSPAVGLDEVSCMVRYVLHGHSMHPPSDQ